MLSFNAVLISTYTKKIHCKILSSEKIELSELNLKINYGTTVNLRGFFKEEKIFQSSLNYSGQVSFPPDYDQQISINAGNVIEKILYDYVYKIKDENLRKIAEYPFTNGEKLYGLNRVGASLNNHHSFKLGLLYHIFDLLKNSETLIDEKNLEIVICCAIWHDIGKLAIFDNEDSSKTVLDNDCYFNHERASAIHFGIAVGDCKFSEEFLKSKTFLTLCSVISNVHNNRVFNETLENIRSLDQISARVENNLSKKKEVGHLPL